MRFPFPIRLWLAAAVLAVAGPAFGAAEQPPVKSPADPLDTALLNSLPPVPEPADSSELTTIPEPVSLAVFGTGLLLLLRRRRF